MATVPRVLCDACRGERNVAEVTVVYGRRPPWSADLCAPCYEELFGVLSRKGRPATRSNVRPQHKFQELDESAFTV